jgi:hypothetical protein
LDGAFLWIVCLTEFELFQLVRFELVEGSAGSAGFQPTVYSISLDAQMESRGNGLDSFARFCHSSFLGIPIRLVT